ncbi:MAG: hypothetical protein M1495_13770 [Bacteroidetes bacterium]|nr:hypothetical protein [Bacteroidota bacterium]MCL6098951.1 hypothetical protein [Bacteroidota bacterium]
MRLRIVFFALPLFLLTSELFAQWISIRTIPVIASNQSEFQPSLARGMGNISIAFDDPLGAQFINPAKASRLNGITLFTSPSRNSWSNDDGRPVFAGSNSSFYPGTSINSIPIGGFFRSDNYFSGIMVAYQGYNGERSQRSFATRGPASSSMADVKRTDVGNNTYLYGLLGMSIPNTGLSVAVSGSWGKFGAIDGVNLLYPGAIDIKQDGEAWEAKFGAVGELIDGDKLEFVAGRSIYKATHEVSYSNFFWLWDDQLNTNFVRTEVNKDETKEWLMYARYLRHINSFWNVGASLSVNWKDHPKIPNYSLANIPRDPGISVAYNIGIGANWSNSKSLWGFEYIYEPITTNTWAEAGEQMLPPPNQNLSPNFKTVENFFNFYNHIIRIGHQSQSKWEWLDYRFGVQFHFYKYNMNQNDNIRRTARMFSTYWLETTASGGLTASLGNIRLTYTLQLVFGNGMVGTASSTIVFDAGTRTNDFLPAPSANLIVDKITLVTQQLTFVYQLE